jgi:hypothetical protein
MSKVRAFFYPGLVELSPGYGPDVLKGTMTVTKGLLVGVMVEKLSVYYGNFDTNAFCYAVRDTADLRLCLEHFH